MKKRLIIACGLLVMATSVLAKSKPAEASELIRIKDGGAILYRVELSGDSDRAATLPGDQEVQLLKEGKARSLIKSGENRGWVDNSYLIRVKGSGNTTRSLKDIEVQGWLDNPSAVYILDNTSAEVANLPLERNFASDIVEKKDREDVERTYDENK
jgi:hypothetical protein